MSQSSHNQLIQPAWADQTDCYSYAVLEPSNDGSTHFTAFQKPLAGGTKRSLSMTHNH